MKNLFLLIASSLIFMVSCTKKETKGNSIERSSNLKQISDWYHLGDIHNEYLMEVCSNFDPKQMKSKEEGLIYINNFLSSFTPSDDRYGENLNEGFSEITKDWTYFLEDELKEHALSQEVSDALTRGVTLGLIDNFEKNLISDFLNLANENYTLEELNTFVDEKILSWEAQGYTESDKFGNYSAMVLAISKKSTEWWLDNEDCLPSNDSRWIWLAWDAAGAAIATASVIISHEVTGSSTPAGNATTIVLGALVASTGMVGKLAKGIKYLWP